MTPDPLTAKGHTTYFPAYRQSGVRPFSAIRYVVLHCTQGGTAASNAAYFHSQAAKGSAHLTCDGDETQRCLADAFVPWAAPNRNYDGFHIELAGYVSWSRLEWLKHWRMLRRAAYKTAAACYRFHIPTQFVGHESMAKRLPGVTTHREVSLYTQMMHLPGDASHTDPGPYFPRIFFMGLVRYYFVQIRRHGGA